MIMQPAMSAARRVLVSLDSSPDLDWNIEILRKLRADVTQLRAMPAVASAISSAASAAIAMTFSAE